MNEINKSLVPVRMLTQYVYCNRLAYLEWVQGEFEANAEVLEGTFKHKNVDKQTSTKKSETDVADELIHARSVMLSDETLGIIGKIDLMEIKGETVTPVEYKRGSTPENTSKTHEDHVVQVCAQGLLLRTNGYTCNKGMIYYTSSKQRIEVDFDEETVQKTLGMISGIKEMAKKNVIPLPLVDSPKCPRCSLVGICLPDETNMLSEGINHINKEHVRRMYPKRDDAIPVYVQQQGAVVTKSGDCIHVKAEKKIIKKIRLIDISDMTVFGNVQITTQAIREMCNRNIPICYMTYGGWFTGMTWGLSHKNVELRMSQYEKHIKKSYAMSIAREIVFAKIKNGITMLRRNHVSPSAVKIIEMGNLAERARTTKQYDTLLGIEGMAARIYFSEFSGMIKSESMDFNFTGRNRRPPKDPVNAILSFLYSMLTRQAVVTASKVGLDPYLGFLHMPKYGKPALALDIIEEFRPIVADSVCITLINNKEITESDLTRTDFGINLTSKGRQAVISAYERRMDASIMHPLLGYTASYRRIMETQARLMSRYILDEIVIYPAFRTR